MLHMMVVWLLYITDMFKFLFIKKNNLFCLTSAV